MGRDDRKIQFTKNVNYFQPSPELKKLQSLMPITADDRDRIKNDIEKTKKIRDPLKVYYNNKTDKLMILAGLNRWLIVKELKLDIKIPYDVYEGLTVKEKEELVINDNLNRRHLTREQKQNLINYFLKADPEQSNKSIAKKTGSTKETVKSQREKLESRGEIRPLEIVKGQDGKQYKKQVLNKKKSTQVKTGPVQATKLEEGGDILEIMINKLITHKAVELLEQYKMRYKKDPGRDDIYDKMKTIKDFKKILEKVKVITPIQLKKIINIKV